MGEQVWLLVNPGSSRADGAPMLKLAAERRAGWRWFESGGPDEVAARVREASCRGVGRVIVAGGDGTVGLTVDAMMRMVEERVRAATDLPTLGVVPMGTANDLAKSLGLPLDPEPALEVAAGDTTRAIDVLRLAHDDGVLCFAVNAITGGLSVQVHDELDAEAKKWWGGFAYARAMFSVLGEAPDYDVTIRAGDAAWRGEAFGLVVSNGPRAGGQTLVPMALPDDGLAEAALVCAPAGAERLKLLAEFATGRHMASDRVRWARASSVRVSAEPAMPLIADGERCGETPVTIDVLHGAVRVAVAPNTE